MSRSGKMLLPGYWNYSFPPQVYSKRDVSKILSTDFSDLVMSWCDLGLCCYFAKVSLLILFAGLPMFLSAVFSLAVVPTLGIPIIIIFILIDITIHLIFHNKVAEKYDGTFNRVDYACSCIVIAFFWGLVSPGVLLISWSNPFIHDYLKIDKNKYNLSRSHDISDNFEFLEYLDWIIHHSDEKILNWSNNIDKHKHRQIELEQDENKKTKEQDYYHIRLSKLIKCFVNLQLAIFIRNRCLAKTKMFCYHNTSDPNFVFIANKADDDETFSKDLFKIGCHTLNSDLTNINNISKGDAKGDGNGDGNGGIKGNEIGMDHPWLFYDRYFWKIEVTLMIILTLMDMTLSLIVISYSLFSLLEDGGFSEDYGVDIMDIIVSWGGLLHIFVNPYITIKQLYRRDKKLKRYEYLYHCTNNHFRQSILYSIQFGTKINFFTWVYETFYKKYKPPRNSNNSTDLVIDSSHKDSTGHASATRRKSRSKSRKENTNSKDSTLVRSRSTSRDINRERSRSRSRSRSHSRSHGHSHWNSKSKRVVIRNGVICEHCDERELNDMVFESKTFSKMGNTRDAFKDEFKIIKCYKCETKHHISDMNESDEYRVYFCSNVVKQCDEWMLCNECYDKKAMIVKKEVIKIMTDEQIHHGGGGSSSSKHKNKNKHKNKHRRIKHGNPIVYYIQSLVLNDYIGKASLLQYIICNQCRLVDSNQMAIEIVDIILQFCNKPVSNEQIVSKMIDLCDWEQGK